MTKYVCMHMRAANQGGSIINISSIAGINRGQLPGSLAYTSSKEALNSITKVVSCFSYTMWFIYTFKCSGDVRM